MSTLLLVALVAAFVWVNVAARRETSRDHHYKLNDTGLLWSIATVAGLAAGLAVGWHSLGKRPGL